MWTDNIPKARPENKFGLFSVFQTRNRMQVAFALLSVIWKLLAFNFTVVEHATIAGALLGIPGRTILKNRKAMLGACPPRAGSSRVAHAPASGDGRRRPFVTHRKDRRNRVETKLKLNT